jgi:hypothetical protein
MSRRFTAPVVRQNCKASEPGLRSAHHLPPRRRTLVSTILAAALMLASTPCAYCSPPMRGIYALGSGTPQQPIPAAVLRNPNVDGIALRYSWNELEPEAGMLDWSDIDRDLAQARRYHKAVSLSVTAGVRTPHWVYDTGALRFTFAWDRPWGFPPCSAQSIPIPWDNTYLSRWKALVRDLGHRYANNPSLIAIKLTGINGATQETQLPHSGGAQMVHGPLTCLNSDSISAWQTSGYTRARVDAAWGEIADAFANAFPNQQLVLMIGPGAFPPIDDLGRLMPHRKADIQLVHELINAGIERFGSRLVVQNNGLSAVRCWYELSALANRVTVGYQMLWDVTDDSRCRMNGGVSPCEPASVLQSSFARGVECEARYIEVYQADILNPALSGIIAQAHQALITHSPAR